MTTSSPEGCRISQGQSYEVSSLEQVIFPYPEDNSQRKNIEKLLSHLERGVILWMAPDGLYAKRLCQSRIYWDGPLALCSDRPNKLERDQTCKLFDTQQFLAGNSLCGFGVISEKVTWSLSMLYGSVLFMIAIAPHCFSQRNTGREQLPFEQSCLALLRAVSVPTQMGGSDSQTTYRFMKHREEPNKIIFPNVVWQRRVDSGLGSTLISPGQHCDLRSSYSQPDPEWAWNLSQSIPVSTWIPAEGFLFYLGPAPIDGANGTCWDWAFFLWLAEYVPI